MGPIDLGPAWFWYLLFALAVVGFFAACFGIGAGVIYLFRHLVWMP